MTPPRLPLARLHQLAALLVLAAALASIACGGDDHDGGTPGIDARSPTDQQDPQGPRFLSLSSNTTEIAEHGELIVTALVTDPDGVADLIGGSLVDAASGKAYGAFATSADEGAYALTLSWTQIDTVSPIYTEGAAVTRTFTAVFFDVAGHRSTRTLDVALACSVTGNYACSGTCVNVQTSVANCGGCDMPAGTAGTTSLTCRGGEPACPGSDLLCDGQCGASWDPDHCTACDKKCEHPAQVADGIRVCSISHPGAECASLFRTTQRISCDAMCASVGAQCGGFTFNNVFHGSTATYVDGHTAGEYCSGVPPATDYDGSVFSGLECACFYAPT